MPMHLQPDPDAVDMAERMAGAEQTMWTILDETTTPTRGGIKESGRTACGGLVDIDSPLKRFPKSVDLQSCPRDLVGTWHSHVTRGQLLNPEHSLPDMANVVFGSVDTSIVVGAETSDSLVAAEDRAAMVDTFQNTLGMEAESTGEVVQALEDGRIQDPEAMRQRVRSAFGPLFHVYQTPFPEMEERIRELSQEDTIATRAPSQGIEAQSPMYSTAYLHGEVASRPAAIKEQVRAVNQGLAPHAIGRRLADAAVGQAMSRAAGSVLDRLF